MTLILSLGSNLGDRMHHMSMAVSYLSRYMKDIQLSSIYETEPLYNTNQPDFLNQVMIGECSIDPFDVLFITQSIQKILGRECLMIPNQPRVIDIDIITYGDICMDHPRLKLPHPMYKERDFVMLPLQELLNRSCQSKTRASLDKV
jgi:2-amino-4-hydroxy-6-hydroxymethyldihydropteridine diphosphokinase